MRTSRGATSYLYLTSVCFSALWRDERKEGTKSAAESEVRGRATPARAGAQHQEEARSGGRRKRGETDTTPDKGRRPGEETAYQRAAFLPEDGVSCEGECVCVCSVSVVCRK